MAFTRKLLFAVGALLVAAMLTTAAAAQAPSGSTPGGFGGGDGGDPGARRPGEPTLVTPVALPRMAPELALTTYEQRLQRQAVELGAYTDTVVIRAELPDTRQQGEYELKRYYQAPRNLSFGALKFVGDTFVKTNVILRLLQSEVDHVEKGQGSDVAISARNYKFSYKGTEVLDGKSVHIYQVKPRQKRVGLFKGRIYLDVFTGSLRRAEGSLVRSPSFFIKKVEFVQDYADFGGFTFLVRIHSMAKTRLIGRAIIDISHSNYEPRAAGSELQPVAAPAAPSPGAH